MALPTITPEARAAALEKAAQVRAERAEVKRLLKQGTTTLPAVLADAADNDAIAKMKVLALILSMPGVGKVPRRPDHGAARHRGHAPGSRARPRAARGARGRVRGVTSVPPAAANHHTERKRAICPLPDRTPRLREAR